MADAINRATFVQRFSVNTPDFPTNDWVINPDMSPVTGVPKKYWKLTGDVLSEMSQAEKDQVDSDNLGSYKLSKIKSIDNRTNTLIAAGFEYPPTSGVFFSLSIPSQVKLSGADAQRDDPAFSYPIVWNNIDDTVTVTLNSSAELHGFVLMAIGTVRAYLDSGTSLKDQVRAASTTVDVDAVADSR